MTAEQASAASHSERSWTAAERQQAEVHVRRLQARIVKAVQGLAPSKPSTAASRRGRSSGLEPCAGKLARTVLRGRGGGNVSPLPDPGTRSNWVASQPEGSAASCAASLRLRSVPTAGDTGCVSRKYAW